MKISELVKKTNVSKETIHYYIREGLLRKPRKIGKNSVNYSEGYVDQIRIIKGLQDNYFLPLSVIKKILRQLRKQSPSRQSSLQLLSEHFRPIDQFLEADILGRETFLKETGLSEKWLNKFLDWGVISCKYENEEEIYFSDDVIIAKLLVDMDNMGLGPKQGYDPYILKRFADFFSEFVSEASREYLQRNLRDASKEEIIEKSSRWTEIMGLFLYHLYRRQVRSDFLKFEIDLNPKAIELN